MYRIIGTDGKEYGPASAEDIRHWLAENRVNAQTLAQAENLPVWRPLYSFSEFFDAIKAAPNTIGPLPPSANRLASNKIAAGIFGILLGSLGIHKFILGYTGAGLVMLLITFLSCFTLAPIMHIIGLIEGIVYLCTSDEDFVRTYIIGRKEWF